MGLLDGFRLNGELCSLCPFRNCPWLYRDSCSCCLCCYFYDVDYLLEISYSLYITLTSACYNKVFNRHKKPSFNIILFVGIVYYFLLGQIASLCKVCIVLKIKSVTSTDICFFGFLASETELSAASF